MASTRAPHRRVKNALHSVNPAGRLTSLAGPLAQVRLRVGGQSLTAVIVADAVRSLKLRRGDDALVIIKSTEVMIARSSRPAPVTRGTFKMTDTG